MRQNPQNTQIADVIRHSRDEAKFQKAKKIRLESAAASAFPGPEIVPDKIIRHCQKNSHSAGDQIIDAEDIREQPQEKHVDDHAAAADDAKLDKAHQPIFLHL